MRQKSIPGLSIRIVLPPLPEHPSTTKCDYILSIMLKWIYNKSNTFTCIFLTDSCRCWYSFGGVISRKGFTFFNYKEKYVYIWCDIFWKKMSTTDSINCGLICKFFGPQIKLCKYFDKQIYLGNWHNDVYNICQHGRMQLTSL